MIVFNRISLYKLGKHSLLFILLLGFYLVSEGENLFYESKVLILYQDSWLKAITYLSNFTLAVLALTLMLNHMHGLGRRLLLS